MRKLRWIHLSDIHFSDYEDYEIVRMRDSLVSKIKELFEKKNVDFIVVSGDLAYQGGTYNAELKSFLDEVLKVTKIETSNLHIVPGNHDIKRSQIRTVLLSGIRTEDFKFETDTLQQLQKDFNKYNSFYSDVKNEENDYVYRVIKKGAYNLFLINTALTAGTDQDEGHLILEKNAFYSEIKQLKEEEKCVNIAIGHHPISCFLVGNQEKIWNNFNDFNIDFYLCGHLHKGAYDYDLSGGRAIPTYQCGGGEVDGYSTVTFLVGELNMETKKGKITSYKWLEKEECWTQGGMDGRRAISGEVEVVLERFQKDIGFFDTDDDLDEDELRRFLMEFHEQITKNGITNTNVEPKDVFDKFSNMKCNKSVEKQYHSLCRYFPIIDDIMESSLLTQIERESIPNVVISEYNKILGKVSNGNEILELIVENIFHTYKGAFNYSNTTLKTYIKILVYWSIYECDIFNDSILEE